MRILGLYSVIHRKRRGCTSPEYLNYEKNTLDSDFTATKLI